MTELPLTDRWLPLSELAGYLGCSKRKLEYDIAKFKGTKDPFPAELIYGRLKARVNEVEAWLERHGRKERA